MTPAAVAAPSTERSCARRDRCAGCGSPDLRPVLDLGTSPPADSFPAAPGTEPFYPLVMAVCQECWLAQLLHVVDGLYGLDYGFFTGGSPAAVRHFAQLAASLLRGYGSQARRLTVEIACNDGTLLEHFAMADCPVLGIDPAAPAERAAERGLRVLREPFTAALAETAREDYGAAGLVVACNVAAHVADPVDFLRGVRALLAPDGVAVFEFQYLADLVAGCQFDHVYHEHRFFYSLSSFTSLAERAGLAVTAWERIPAQGGSLRVVAVPEDTAHPWVPVRPRAEQWLAAPGTYEGMQFRAEYIRDRLLALLHGERVARRAVAGYAASAKSATLLNFCRIGPDLVPSVVDITPAKIGRFTPGTHIPIVEPGAAPDTYLLLAWNYLSSVLRREREFLAGGGRFIVPIPVPVKM